MKATYFLTARVAVHLQGEHRADVADVELVLDDVRLQRGRVLGPSAPVKSPNGTLTASSRLSTFARSSASPK